MDIGDIVGVKGTALYHQTGEISIHATGDPSSKSLQVLPESSMAWQQIRICITASATWT